MSTNEEAAAVTGWVADIAREGSDVVVFPDGSHIIVQPETRDDGITVLDNGWVKVSRTEQPTISIPPHRVIAVATARRPRGRTSVTGV